MSVFVEWIRNVSHCKATDLQVWTKIASTEEPHLKLTSAVYIAGFVKMFTLNDLAGFFSVPTTTRRSHKTHRCWEVLPTRFNVLL